MAGITINTGDVFPDGTSVRAYLQSQVPETGGTPSGSPSATATATSGLVTFTGLAEATGYVAYANVSGQNRYRRFYVATPGVASPSSPSVAGDPSMVFNVTADVYGADATGVADSFDAIQAAIDAAAAAGGGIVYLPVGTFKLSKTGAGALKLPYNLAGRIVIRGAGRDSTILRLTTTGATSAFTTLANGQTQTLQHVSIEDLTVDCNNVPAGANGVLLALEGSFHINDLRVRRIRHINVGASLRRNIDITIVTAGVNQTPYYNVTGVTIEDCDFTSGGDTGIALLGYTDGGTPTQKTGRGAQTYPAFAGVTFDDIFIQRCQCDSAKTVSVLAASAGIQVGESAICGRVVVRDCKVSNYSDVGYEFDTIADLTVENCYAANCVSEGFYSTTLGGPGKPETDTHRYIGCTYERTNANLGISQGFKSDSAFGLVPPNVVYERCVYKDTSSGKIGATNAPFTALAGHRVVVRDCRAAYSNLNSVFTSNTTSVDLVGVVVSCGLTRSHVTIDGFLLDISGSASQNAGITGGVIGFTGVNITNAADARFSVNDVKVRNRLIRSSTPGTPPQTKVRGCAIDLFGLAAATDNFSTDRTTKDFLLDNGADANVTVTSNALIPAGGADLTAEQRYAWVLQGTSASSPQPGIGVGIDGWLYMKFTPGATLTGFKAGVIAKRTTATDYIEAWVDGTNLHLDKVVAGARTQLAAPVALTTPLVAGTAGWVRIKAIGDTVTADHFVGSAPAAVITVGDSTLSATAATTDIEVWGRRAVGRWGFSWVPQDTAASVDDLTRMRNPVYGGVFRGVSLMQVRHETGLVTNIAEGFNTAMTDNNSRWVGVTFADCDFSRASGAQAATDFNFPSTPVTGLKTNMRRRDVLHAAVPAPAAITPGASPYTYTNQDGFEQDVAIYSGTVSVVSVTRANGTAGQVAATTGAAVRLQPGDSVTVTYSVAPTMRSVPVL